MKSVSLRMKHEICLLFFFPDFIYYRNFKQQLQMKTGFTLVDPRRQMGTQDLPVAPIREEIVIAISLK